jgi:hypothetical protein
MQVDQLEERQHLAGSVTRLGVVEDLAGSEVEGGHSGQVGEGFLVGGDEGPVCGPGDGGDHQVVGPAGSSLFAYGYEQFGVFTGDD